MSIFIWFICVFAKQAVGFILFHWSNRRNKIGDDKSKLWINKEACRSKMGTFKAMQCLGMGKKNNLMLESHISSSMLEMFKQLKWTK